MTLKSVSATTLKTIGVDTIEVTVKRGMESIIKSPKYLSLAVGEFMDIEIPKHVSTQSSLKLAAFVDVTKTEFIYRHNAKNSEEAVDLAELEYKEVDEELTKLFLLDYLKACQDYHLHLAHFGPKENCLEHICRHRMYYFYQVLAASTCCELLLRSEMLFALYYNKIFHTKTKEEN